MRFTLIDRILELEPGRRIVAVKSISSSEDYLQDHFPGFPVIPGVLLLEALTQASAWMVRVGEDFFHSMVVLRRVSHARFGHFVRPGQLVTLISECLDDADRHTRCRAQGMLDGRPALSATLTLHRYNLAETDPALAWADQRIRQHLATWLMRLWEPMCELMGTYAGGPQDVVRVAWCGPGPAAAETRSGSQGLDHARRVVAHPK